jgi:glucokinase
MAYRFAVDIGATKTMLALIDGTRPEIVAYERPSTEVLFTGHRPAGLALADTIERFLRGHSVDMRDVLGVGVGIPGIVDRDSGTVLSCPNLKVLDGAALGDDASIELGVPVCLDNNTNLISLGEHTAGIGQGVEHMAVIFVGSGLGCGLIMNSRLYEGADGAAGELGHTIVVRNGLLCSCGAHGCLEMYCSGKALTLVAQKLFKPSELFALNTRFAGAQLLTEQARAGHPRAVQAMTEAFTYLGLGLTNLVNLFNPRMIVLGGGIVLAWPDGVEVARKIVMSEALVGARRNLRMEVSHLQNMAGVLGGAALVSMRCAATGPHP